ncbi:uncharacterized protein LOC127263977 [Andrographis paniculata]|uniref:uncharacterized protein LOC127263977 n=1 Tax=Andrographis paniculata TaxID=175694 RepID=UPI0021E99A96|nr:uncharacterized protein LOC127263977 [Andrographis paniculata]
MRRKPRRGYLGGEHDYFDFVDIDKLSVLEMWGYAEKLGYKEANSVRFWLKYGNNFDRQCKCLESDKDILWMTKHIPDNYELEIYLEHLDIGLNQDPQSNIISRIKDLGGEVPRASDCVEGEMEENDSDFDDLDNEVELESGVLEVDIEGRMKGQSIVDNFTVAEDVLKTLQKEDGEADVMGNDSKLNNGMESDGSEKEGTNQFEIYNSNTGGENPELKLGLLFKSRAEAKFSIESHCFRRGMSVKFSKIDKSRLRATCKKQGCEWFVLVSKVQGDEAWKLCSMNEVHSKCGWTYDNTSIKSSWIGKTFMKKLKENPKLDPGAFRDEICRTLRCKVSMSKAYRARRKALDLLHGSNVEQYDLLWDYCNDIERCNPGTGLSLKLIDDEESGLQWFQRIYVCFSACKRGFLESCRPVVGVDRCWLKKSFGGQLLSVVGIDANNNIFPIAYAVVEVEKKNSWLWFLEWLKRDLDIEDGYNWTFTSDKQKGLISAFESILPQAENRFCVRHLHTNIKRDGYASIAVKRLLWAAAKATTIPEFK